MKNGDGAVVGLDTSVTLKQLFKEQMAEAFRAELTAQVSVMRETARQVADETIAELLDAVRSVKKEETSILDSVPDISLDETVQPSVPGSYCYDAKVGDVLIGTSTPDRRMVVTSATAKEIKCHVTHGRSLGKEVRISTRSLRGGNYKRVGTLKMRKAKK